MKCRVGASEWRQMASGDFSSGGSKKEEQRAKNCHVCEGGDALRGAISRRGIDARKESRDAVRGVKPDVEHRESRANIFKNAPWPRSRMFRISGSECRHREGHEGSPSDGKRASVCK